MVDPCFDLRMQGRDGAANTEGSGRQEKILHRGNDRCRRGWAFGGGAHENQYRHLTTKVEYYDRKGELLKTALFKDYKKYGKFWRFGSIHMDNVQTRKKSIMTWNSRKVGVKHDEDEFDSYEEMKHFMMEAESDVTIEVTDEQGNLFHSDDQVIRVNGRATVRQFATNKDGVSATFSFGDDVSDKPMGKLADGTVKILMKRVKDAAVQAEPLTDDE